jgi:hypothetical protein
MLPYFPFNNFFSSAAFFSYRWSNKNSDKWKPQKLTAFMNWYEHRVHRVATAAFWRTFNHEGKKLARAGEGEGCTPTPFHYIYHHQQSCSVRYAPAKRADTITLFQL